MKLFTMGFSKKSADEFFTKLINAGVKQVLDIRLWNTSVLAGFTKKNDLEFFLNKIGNIGYKHLPLLAPTEQLLDKYKKGEIAWSEYERDFLTLLNERKPENELATENLDAACLLCSEKEPMHCHRRLVAEYLTNKFGNMEIIHLI